MSAFVVFVILPPANIQVNIFVNISRQYGEKSINNVAPINESVKSEPFCHTLQIFVHVFFQLVLQVVKGLKSGKKKENSKLNEITYFLDQCFPSCSCQQNQILQ